MQNFLEHLSVGNKPSFFHRQLFQQKPGFGFIRMRCTNQVHRDVGIDEDHGSFPVYPVSISASIVSMSAVGNEYSAATRMASSFWETLPEGSCRRAAISAWRTHSAIDIRRARAAR